jgi:hypothetical protein
MSAMLAYVNSDFGSVELGNVEGIEKPRLELDCLVQGAQKQLDYTLTTGVVPEKTPSNPSNFLEMPCQSDEDVQ